MESAIPQRAIVAVVQISTLLTGMEILELEVTVVTHFRRFRHAQELFPARDTENVLAIRPTVVYVPMAGPVPTAQIVCVPRMWLGLPTLRQTTQPT